MADSVDLRDVVRAYADPKSGRVEAVTYEIPALGLFIRDAGSWRFAREKEMYNLFDKECEIYDVQRQKALEIVEKYDDALDEGRGISLADLDGYIVEEEGPE